MGGADEGRMDAELVEAGEAGGSDNPTHTQETSLGDEGGGGAAAAAAAHPLFSAIKLRDVSKVRELLADDPAGTRAVCGGLTPILVAARVRHLAIINLLLQHGAQVKVVDEQGNTVLHRAIASQCHDQDSLRRILQIFLDAGVNVNSTNQQKHTPLFLAARFRLPKIVEFLLSDGVKANPALVARDGESVVHAACHKGSAACLAHLLNTGLIDHLVTQPNHQDVEPFLYAVRSSSIDCCELLLNKGDHLTRVHVDGVSRCSHLLQYLPSATDLLKRLFDARITLSEEHQYDTKFSINFDYLGILPQKGSERRPQRECLLHPQRPQMQSSLLVDLNTSEAEHLFKHPLLETFLGSKWAKIKFFFYGNLVLFFLFLLCHTVYIVTIYGKKSVVIQDCAGLVLFCALHAFLYCLVLFPEVLTILANPQKYLKHLETLTKATSIVCSGYVVFINITMCGCREEETVSPGNLTSGSAAAVNETGGQLSAERQVAAVSVFSGWVELMMMCGRLPILGSNVLMFSRVAKSSIKFIAAFASLLIGFSTSFLVLFYEQEEFDTFWTSLVKTLMMMIGEVDYGDLVDQTTAYISYILLVVFLFLVCVLMANLLIGLAVDDITRLEKLGQIDKLSKQASYIVTFEKFAMFAQKCPLVGHRMATHFTQLPRVDDNVSFFINKQRAKRCRWFRYSLPKDVAQTAVSIATSRQRSEAVATDDDLTAAAPRILEELKRINEQLQEMSSELRSCKQD